MNERVYKQEIWLILKTDAGVQYGCENGICYDDSDENTPAKSMRLRHLRAKISNPV
jgi:hypothetical protein